MRSVVLILALLLVIGGLAGTKFLQISKLIHFGQQAQKAGPPPEVVSSATATSQTWENTLSAVGSVTAAKGVTLSNDAPGVVSRIHFESGANVREGQVLLELDSSVERAQLASSQARLELASLNATRSRALGKSGAIAQSAVDTDEATNKTSSRDLTTLQAQIDRKIVRAPFTGKLGIRQVNLGQYLNPGTAIAVLEATDTVYVDFTLPQQRLADVKLGLPVRMTIEGLEGVEGDGVIAAIDPAIDSTTRTIRLRASVPNQKQTLRPGMFARVAVVLPQQATLVTVPATAIVHASYGDSAFVLEPKKDEAGAPVTGADGKPVLAARQQFVRVGQTRGDFVSIVDGITAGQQIVSAGAFKLRNGASVVLNNDDVVLAPNLDPHPVNR